MGSCWSTKTHMGVENDLNFASLTSAFPLMRVSDLWLNKHVYNGYKDPIGNPVSIIQHFVSRYTEIIVNTNILRQPQLIIGRVACCRVKPYLKAPLSDIDCVYYNSRVDEYLSLKQAKYDTDDSRIDEVETDLEQKYPVNRITEKNMISWYLTDPENPTVKLLVYISFSIFIIIFMN